MKTLVLTILTCVMSAVATAQVPDFTPQTPLIGALLHQDLAEARRLVNTGANPNEGRFVGMPPLFLAILRHDRELVRLMIDKGADLDARDLSGSTALMWAAFDESGDPAVVQELLTRGADPAATNKAGETALVWAARRGETPTTTVLRKASDSTDAAIAPAVERSLALLQRSAAQFSKVSTCFSCHHQALPQLAFGLARTRGLKVDEEAAARQVDVIAAMMEAVAPEAEANRDRIPDVPISVSYGLIALAASHYQADETTRAMAHVVSAWQGPDGAFSPLPAMRPPMESSAFTATALSVRALQLFDASAAARVDRAAAWLRTATPSSTEDRAMQVLGLAWAHAPAHEIAKAAEALVALQRPDGGWAQLPALETDAYATGQALVALQAAGRDVTGSVYQRGVAFLLRTQFADGSWLVRTRSFPVQPRRDTGFPHAQHQWISAAGTSWAAMALTLALPPQASESTTGIQ